MRFSTVLIALAWLLVLVPLLVYGNPVVDPNAENVAGGPLPCESGSLIVGYDYDGGPRGYWRIFKWPNQEVPRVVLYWKPGNDGGANHLYLNGEEIKPIPMPFSVESVCQLLAPHA